MGEASRIAEAYARRHGLRLGTPFDSSVGYAVPAELSNGLRAVVKVNPPGERECEQEAAALAHYDGRGAVRLLDYDSVGHTMLLERCDPGTSLWELPEEDANRLAAGVLARLWRPPSTDSPFATLAEEAEFWAAELEPRAEEQLVRLALQLLCDLVPSQGEQVVVHQDLHQGNILRAQREPWLAIDPKPLVGEREFDVASLIRDRRDAFDATLVRRRLDFYTTELGLDRERTRGWAIAHAVAWGTNEQMLASARALV
jgi:streptomycin 6-kinase